MTKSPTTSTPELTKPVPQSSSSGLRSLLVLIYRLLLLGVGSGLAAIVGVAIAELYPAQTEEPPLVERLMQSSQSLLANLRQLPDMWNGRSEPTPSPSVIAPSPQPAPVTPSLSNTERQQLQAELTQLQAELQTLTESSTEPLAARVEELQKRIQSIQERLNTFTTAPASPTAEPIKITPTSNTQAGSNQLMVTLPSDALFNADQRTLRTETTTILDSIVGDLQRYPDATIQVSAHIDQQGSAEEDRSRTFEQAKAIQRYLAGKLGENVHWVTIGHGHSRPLVANDTPENRQRNRRVELTIDP
ncbi:MAG: OmpA family protein [Synechococcales cyanobacterium M58_A2018_015]|nr:OmpA family protein [Synechococcales cyanobacterium M58_A2018_015]